MSFVDLPGIDDVREKSVVPEGSYDLRVTGVKAKEKDGKHGLQIVIDIEGEADAQAIFFHMSFPSEKDEKESREFKMLQIKRFCHQFAIPLDGGLDTENIVGSVASGAKVVQIEVDDEYAQYAGQLRNEIKLNPLPNEG